MPTQLEQFERALETHASDFGIELQLEHVRALKDYYALLLNWNPRLHLVAPCSAAEFATRHVLESLLMIKHLPADARVADIGSGGGLPMIPALVLRNDLDATLIESSERKSVFLREALRVVDRAGRARVLAVRFEEVKAPDVDFVACRALDRFSQLLPPIIEWAPANATFLFFAGESLRKQLESSLRGVSVKKIPKSNQRFLVVGRKPV